MAMNSKGALMLMSTPGRNTSHARGITTSPAMMACTMPAMIFLDRNPGDINRRKQAIFNFAGPLEFGDQGHADRPNSGEYHAHRDNARKQQTLVSSGHVAATHHDAAKMKTNSNGCRNVWNGDLNCVAPRHMDVAGQHRGESFPVQSRKLLPVWCRKRFSRLGSEMCTSRQLCSGFHRNRSDLRYQSASLIGINVSPRPKSHQIALR